MKKPIIFLLACSSVLLAGCEMLKCRTEKNIVQSVGGCDKSARCAVVFTDGSIGRAYYPVVGGRVDERVCE